MNNLVSVYYEPQINADERRFINLDIQHLFEFYPVNSMNESLQSTQSSAFTTYEKAAASRFRTRMTRIGRIFTDTHNPCVSVSSAQSVFHPINQINHISALIFGAIKYSSHKGEAL